MAVLSSFENLMGTIAYLVKNVNNSGDAINAISRAKATYNQSIAARAKQNICQFPLLTSSTISVQSYQKSSEILEQLYAQYLKLLIVNSTEVINLEKDNKLSIVARVHQNDNALNNTDFQKTTENILAVSNRSESVALEQFKELLSFLNIENYTESELIEANKALLKVYNENFNLKNLNGSLSEASNGYTNEILTKYDLLSQKREREATLVKTISNLEYKIIELKRQNPVDKTKVSELENEKDKKERDLKIIKADIQSLLEIIKSLSNKQTLWDAEQKASAAAEKEAREATKDAEKRKSNEEKRKFRKQFGSVSDFDNTTIKKNNSLEPSILSFELKYTTTGGDFETTKMALAVKTVTHLVQSDELVFYMNETLDNNKKIFKAIQLLTGEKKFSLNFLLGLDKAKRDAKADSTTAKWWRHLKDRRMDSMLLAARGNDPYVPNATIVMSYEDYETLKLMYRKDIIKDTKLAYKLTNLLFLMHLVIINDVSNEFLIYDSYNRVWETYTLDKLQSEINTMNKQVSSKSLR